MAGALPLFASREDMDIPHHKAALLLAATGSWWERLSSNRKALVVLFGTFLMGIAAGSTLVNLRGIPDRLEEVEERQAEIIEDSLATLRSEAISRRRASDDRLTDIDSKLEWLICRERAETELQSRRCDLPEFLRDG